MVEDRFGGVEGPSAEFKGVIPRIMRGKPAATSAGPARISARSRWRATNQPVGLGSACVPSDVTVPLKALYVVGLPQSSEVLCDFRLAVTLTAVAPDFPGQRMLKLNIIGQARPRSFGCQCALTRKMLPQYLHIVSPAYGNSPFL